MGLGQNTGLVTEVCECTEGFFFRLLHKGSLPISDLESKSKWASQFTSIMKFAEASEICNRKKNQQQQKTDKQQKTP